MLKSYKNSSRHFLIVLIILSICLLTFPSSLAWDNCPFGEVNEPYPGTCGRYTDSDNDGICDLSQASPDTRIQISEENSNQQENVSSNATDKTRLNYYFIPILIILSIFYTITYALSKKRKITLAQHRKIWNMILLITFLVSGIFGLILAITISSSIRLSFYATLLFWHVEFGIAMAIISIFHIGWHWRYYKKVIMGKNK